MNWKTVFPSFAALSPQECKTTVGHQEEPTHRYSWISMRSEVRPEHGAGRRRRLRGTDPEPRRRSSGLLLSLHPLHPPTCGENRQGHDLRNNKRYCSRSSLIQALSLSVKGPQFWVLTDLCCSSQTPVEQCLKIIHPTNVFFTASCKNV